MLKMKLVLELDENFSTWKLHGFAWGKCIRQCFMMIMVWGFAQLKPECLLYFLWTILLLYFLWTFLVLAQLMGNSMTMMRDFNDFED